MSARLSLVSAAFVAALSSTLLAVRSAHADPPPAPIPESSARVTWNEDLPRFRAWEYVSTIVLGGTFFVLEYTVPTPQTASWKSGILFDNAARKLFVLNSPTARDAANAKSDYFTLAPQFFVFADAAASLVYGASPDVAWQMTTMDLESLAVGGLLTRMGEYFVKRERPTTVACASDPSYSTYCHSGAAASFPSGHTSLAFTAAGLMCAHHTNLPLYGGGAADIATCVAGLGVATTSATLRLMADRHWTSDVIVGIALGLGSGWGLPEILHYHPWMVRHSASDATFRWAVAPMIDGTTVGATTVGLFLRAECGGARGNYV